MTIRKTALLAAIATISLSAPALSAELTSIGITLGSLGNPFFVPVQGCRGEGQADQPDVKVTAVSADYDLNKQFTQIDNFIASGVDMILLNAADRRDRARVARPGRRHRRVAVDVAAAGADATVQTNNVQAGRDRLPVHRRQAGRQGQRRDHERPAGLGRDRPGQRLQGGAGQGPGIKILSDDQDGKGSREGGLNVMQGLLTAFDDIDAVFTINDPQAIGSDLAAKQLGRSDIIITSVDGAPDIERR